MNIKIDEISENLKQIKEKSPLIHCITNVVTVRDCANTLLAIGASPIMANEPDEASDITSIANSLVINIGTLTKEQIKTMQKSAKTAKDNNIPIILDPVGIGVSEIRNQTSIDIIKEVKPTIIRGNLSEIKAVAMLYGILDECNKAKGVDVAETDIISPETLKSNSILIKKIAEKLDTTIAVSGPIDIISDGNDVYTIDNGDQMLSKITGAGCMLTSIMGGYAAITNSLDAAICATLTMDIAGEIAAKQTIANNQGTGSFGIYLMDEFYNMDMEKILTYAKIKKQEL
ncbi:hydroxyethylthiazole kinase [Methanosphaera cuniculi]|uniref:Hydroxyethylthiazole kinase n=1 Tax=Methanosphaera cuniculi TaxID=1077256 RepID=A0A2A2HF81_9EURY|nr:hydroxyethylthiazole kinase [Methanosphaera cuniculi]PAV08131.1 hydroxyethylthiazole kinase [Methanosphaera cuniculi]PWL07768.1 hydroxyethylthiazole kinase [Methanosphaera cuniculi]